MTKFDIKTLFNLIGGRQGWAYICNSNRFSVLKVDLDIEQEYETYKEYGEVRVLSTSRNGFNLITDSRLVWNEGKYQLTSWGCGISGSFGFYDAMELVEGANVPKIKEGEIVALAIYSAMQGSVRLELFKIGKTNIHCQTVATLEPLNEDEMKQIAEDADRWCRR